MYLYIFLFVFSLFFPFLLIFKKYYVLGLNSE